MSAPAPRAMLLLCAMASGSPRDAQAQEPVDFVRDVRPILRDACWRCHGFDQQKGRLRLDTRSGAFAGSRNGAVIVAGRSGESALVERIVESEAGRRMPQKAERLTEAQIATIRSWIDQGAHWPDAAADLSGHWAFRPPVAPQPPPVADEESIRDPIDRFVRARLEREGLAPSPEASRETLLRRVSLDLTGLPPVPEEIDRFLADAAPDAYETQVDRLLASPRYGERMAWEWLEAARYADTNGYQEDRTRTMWPWRDWVVEALNRNLPFDRFTIEQIAGDLLPGATLEQRLATGFHRNHPLNGEGGAIAEESRHNYVFDRVDTTATVWLGVTLGCARCHDHKFDPFRQEEYYRFAAFFNNVAESGGVDAGGNAKPVMALPTVEQAARIEELDAATAELEARLARLRADEDPGQAEWESRTRGWLDRPPLLGPWRTRGPFAAPGFDAACDTEFEPELRRREAADGAEERAAWTPRPEWVDGQVHPLSGDNAATYLERTLELAEPVELVFSLGSDDAIKGWLDGEPFLSRKVTRAAAPDQERVAIAAGAGVHRLLLKIVNGGGPAGFYFKLLEGGLPDELAAIVRLPAAARSTEQAAALRRHHAENVLPDGRAAVQRLATLRAEHAELDARIPSVMVMEELAPPRETFVLEKGSYERPGRRVEAGVPEVLGAPPEGAGMDRLALARWLVGPDQPLTARVAANRMWQTFFGAGLVRTAEDFGLRGEPPSHPDLLDWLAAEFVRSGWDVKALQRRIVTSATYRQSSRIDAAALERDPENRLLARGPRGRLPSYMLRDQALALGGLLVERLGGPPVRPWQPDGVWEEATFGTIRYERDSGEALHRRSLYTFWRRIAAPTMFFDVAARQVCTVRVARTNTPLQALVLLNDVTYVEAARAFAQRLLGGGAAAPGEWIAAAFRAASGRAPAPEELAILADAHRRALERFRADRAAAARLVAVGEAGGDPRLDAAAHAAATVVASLLLNLDEVVSKE